ncbi:MAG: DsbA family protein, partial [Pseudomonadota bacterium]
AMRTAMVAHADDVVDRFFPAVQTAMWETGRDIAKPDVLAAVLDEVGLPGQDMVARTQDPDIKQALMDATQAAVEHGLFGLPSWFDSKGEMYFGKDNCWMFGADPIVRPG